MIIFISGSINTGKSTIIKILAKELPNSALIEVDLLREMIYWMPLDKAIPINIENAVSLVKNFSKKSLNSIVEYPLGPKSHAYIMNEHKNLVNKLSMIITVLLTIFYPHTQYLLIIKYSYYGLTIL